uniref:Peptidase S1 domain-containing protein n=1 Tax=Romanomermis culicivorax TaxID=13658 RepID=A0A915K8Y0_ROMCU
MALKSTPFQDKNVYFVNVATYYQWIIDAIEYSDVPIVFHNQLDEYESKMKHDITLSAGSNLKNKNYEEIWHNSLLYNKIDVKSNKIAFLDNQDQRQIWNSTIEENSYDCTITCYLKNNGNPCSYSKQSKECFFASKVVEPTATSSKVISIYFKEN